MKKQVLSIRFFTLLCCIFSLPLLATAQYCNPSYSYNCTYGSYEMWINNFSTTGGVTNITNNNSGCGNASTSYTFYSKLTHAGIQGTNVNFSVTTGSKYPLGVKIWVDYNADGDFVDAGELVYSPTSTQSAGGTGTGSFTIPANAPPGLTRMRVRCSYSTVSFTECNSQSYGECEDYVFEVVPSCSAKFTANPEDARACETGTAFFTVKASLTDSFHWEANYGGPIPTWVRIGDDANQSGTLTDSLKLKNLSFAWNNIQYRAVAHNAKEGCTVNSKPAKLTMVPTTKASIVITSNPDSEICAKTPVTVFAAWTNGGNAPKYQWMVNGLDVQGAINGTFNSDSLNNGDIVTCRFSSSNICVYPEVSNGVNYVVHDILQPEVLLIATDNEDGSYTFTALPKNGGTNPKYQWYRNAKVIAKVNGDTYTASDLTPSDKIVVELFSNEKCLAAGYSRVNSNIASITTVGVTNANMSLSGLKLHPNPTTGNFTIQGAFKNGLAGKDITVTVINTLGQVVYNDKYTVGGTDFSIPVTINDKAANGVYTVNIKVDNDITSMRFVLNR